MAAYHQGISTEAITRAGAELGFENLSLGSVARRLNVTTPALYRHVANRRELEQQVAAELLREVSVVRECPDARGYLIFLAQTFFRVCRDNPGLERYLLTDFPSDPQSERISNEAAEALRGHGYGEEAAASLAGITATYAISLAASARARNVDDDLVEVAPGLALNSFERFTLMILPAIDGMLTLVGLNDSLADIVEAAKVRLP